MNKLNMLSFDIEDWYHANYEQVDMSGYRSQTSNFRQNMHKLLDICARNNAKATFFTLGSIAEDFPDVIKEIVAQGHELASHGYCHELAYKQDIIDFRADVAKSIDILQDVSGVQIKGYRAPSWSIIKENLHYLDILQELGLVYDASIFPVKTFLYGIPDAPQRIHNPTVDGRELKLYEVPMSVQSVFGKTIGYSGGFYLRLFPEFLIDYFIKNNLKKDKYTILYLHPRELDPTEKRLELPFLENIIHYYGINSTTKKLNSLLGKYEFTSISNYLELQQQP